MAGSTRPGNNLPQTQSLSLPHTSPGGETAADVVADDEATELGVGALEADELGPCDACAVVTGCAEPSPQLWDDDVPRREEGSPQPTTETATNSALSFIIPARMFLFSEQCYFNIAAPIGCNVARHSPPHATACCTQASIR